MNKQTNRPTVAAPPAHWPPAMLLLMLLLLGVLPGQAQAQILDNIEVLTDIQRPEISVNFTIGMQYLTHEPPQTGREIQIQLRPIQATISSDKGIDQQETLSWTPTDDVPLQDVRYDGSLLQVADDGTLRGNPLLVLRFSREVRFEVRSAADLRSLRITLIPDEKTSEAVPPEPSQPVEPIDATVKIPRERIQALMSEARQAMEKKDYSRAIQLYTKIAQYPAHTYTQAAREYLGLARERNGQWAHAKAEYERFLLDYPSGAAADRVRQRLAGLVTARMQPQEKLRPAKGKAPAAAEPPSAWDSFGSFSQFYSRDTNITDQDGQTVSRSSLSTDLDYSARLRNRDYDVRTRFSGGYLHDFLNSGAKSETRISSLYVDATDRKHDIQAKLGRQTRSSGGVLGRFDGGVLSYRWLDKSKLNLVAGLPVDTTADGVKTNRFFYGASVDVGTIANAWDFVGFAIQQDVDGISDRRAVGGEIRYFKPNQSVLTLVDYDISYDELNTFLLIGNWTFANKLTLNTVVDVRKSPLLTTRNALQSQTTVTSIDDLLKIYSEDEVRQLARDRTADSKTFTLGLSKPLTEKLQLSGDVTVTELGATAASGGVEAMPASGPDYFYNLQLTGSGLIKPGDIAIIGARYSTTSTSDVTSLTLNTRYPVNDKWRINPRLRIDYRDNTQSNTTQWVVSPTFRTEYRWQKRYHFELEAGGDWSNLQLTDTTDKSSAYYITLGYRIDF